MHTISVLKKKALVFMGPLLYLSIVGILALSLLSQNNTIRFQAAGFTVTVKMQSLKYVSISDLDFLSLEHGGMIWEFGAAKPLILVDRSGERYFCKLKNYQRREDGILIQFTEGVALFYQSTAEGADALQAERQSPGFSLRLTLSEKILSDFQIWGLEIPVGSRSSLGEEELKNGFLRAGQRSYYAYDRLERIEDRILIPVRSYAFENHGSPLLVLWDETGKSSAAQAVFDKIYPQYSARFSENFEKILESNGRFSSAERIAAYLALMAEQGNFLEKAQKVARKALPGRILSPFYGGDQRAIGADVITDSQIIPRIETEIASNSFSFLDRMDIGKRLYRYRQVNLLFRLVSLAQRVSKDWEEEFYSLAFLWRTSSLPSSNLNMDLKPRFRNFWQGLETRLAADGWQEIRFRFLLDVIQFLGDPDFKGEPEPYWLANRLLLYADEEGNLPTGTGRYERANESIPADEVLRALQYLDFFPDLTVVTLGLSIFSTGKTTAQYQPGNSLLLQVSTRNLPGSGKYLIFQGMNFIPRAVWQDDVPLAVLGTVPFYRGSGWFYNPNQKILYVETKPGGNEYSSLKIFI